MKPSVPKPSPAARDAALRSVLRAGDPAGEPAAFDRARLRREVLSAARERPVGRPWVAVAAAVAAGLAALVVGYLRAPQPPLGAPGVAPPAATGGPSLSSGAGSGDETRQLQFETPGGTRIIWLVTDAAHP